MPSAIPCSLSPFISRIHSCLFLNWRRIVSSKFFETQVPSISTKELVLPRPLSSTLQRTQHSVKLLSLYDWQNQEPFMQRLQTLVPGHLPSHSALSGYELFAPLTLWRLSVSLQSLVQTLGNCPASGAPWSSAMPPSLGRSRITTTTTGSCVKERGLRLYNDIHSNLQQNMINTSDKLTTA